MEKVDIASYFVQDLRAVLIEQLFFQIFLFFFSRKTGKTGNISKVWKNNRGQNILEGFAFQYLETKFGKYGNIKNCAKKKSGKFRQNVSYDKNGPKGTPNTFASDAYTRWCNCLQELRLRRQDLRNCGELVCFREWRAAASLFVFVRVLDCVCVSFFARSVGRVLSPRFRLYSDFERVLTHFCRRQNLKLPPYSLVTKKELPGLFLRERGIP